MGTKIKPKAFLILPSRLLTTHAQREVGQKLVMADKVKVKESCWRIYRWLISKYKVMSTNLLFVHSLLLLEYQTVRIYENGKIDRVLATNIKVDEDSGNFLRKTLLCKRKGKILILPITFLL